VPNEAVAVAYAAFRGSRRYSRAESSAAVQRPSSCARGGVLKRADREREVDFSSHELHLPVP